MHAISWLVTICSLIMLNYPSMHSQIHTTHCTEKLNSLLSWDNACALSVCQLSGVHRISKDKTVSGSILVSHACLGSAQAFSLCQWSPYDLWQCTLEPIFCLLLSCNEKQRAALSSAGNNAALDPHGSLIGPLLNIRPFDLH